MTYSYQYWRLLADGYESQNLPIPDRVVEGLLAAKAEQTVRAADWMVVDDGGREMARIVWAESGYKPWAKNIHGPLIPALNVFMHGPQDAFNAGRQYLAIKRRLDLMWEELRNRHRRTKAFIEVEDYMNRHGMRNHSYPREVESRFCHEQEWLWTPQMGIGTGTQVHAAPGEVPDDCLVKITGTYLAVVGGKLYVPSQVYIDRDATRGGQRAVYGWWTKVVA